MSLRSSGYRVGTESEFKSNRKDSNFAWCYLKPVVIEEARKKGYKLIHEWQSPNPRCNHALAIQEMASIGLLAF